MRNNKTHFMFRDRLEAGLLLAAKLKKYKNDPGLVLAVPRGWSASCKVMQVITVNKTYNRYHWMRL